jgi:hypothetical protein
MQQATKPSLLRAPLDRDPQGCQVNVQPVVQEALQPDAQPLALGAIEELAVRHLDLRPQGADASFEPCDRYAIPCYRLVIGQGESSVRRSLCQGHATRHFLTQCPPRCAQDQLLLVTFCFRVGEEVEATDAPDRVALHHDLAATGYRREQLLLLASFQPAHQVRGAPVDEAAGQPIMQRIREQVFDLAGTTLPVRAVLHPVGPRGDVRPDADTGQPLHQRVDIAIGPRQRTDLPGQPVSRQVLVLGDMAEYARAEPCVRVIGQLAEVGDLAGIPEAANHPAPPRQTPGLGLAGQRGECLEIGGVFTLDQARPWRRRQQAGEQRIHVREVQVAVAPAELIERIETVGFHRGNHLIRQRLALRSGAKCPVAHAAAGAAGNLRHLGCG